MPVQTMCPKCDTNHTLSDDKSGKKIRCKKCSEPFTVGANGKMNGKSNAPGLVEVLCPECDAPMKVRSESLGKRVKCKKCEEIFTAKAKNDEDEDDDEKEVEEEKVKTSVTAKAPKIKPASAKKKDDEDDDEDEDEGKGKKGKKKKKKSKKGGLPILLIAGGGGGVLVLIAVIIVVIVLMSGGDEPPAPPKKDKDGGLVKKDKDKTPVNKDKDKDGKPKDPVEEPKVLVEIKNDPVPKQRLILALDVANHQDNILKSVNWFRNPTNSDLNGQCIVVLNADSSETLKNLAKAKPWLLVKGNWIDKETKQKAPGIYVEHPLRTEVAKDLEKLIDHPQLKLFDDTWGAWTKWATVEDLDRLALHLTRASRGEHRLLVMNALARIKTEESAKVQASCLASPEFSTAVTLLREMGGEVSVQAVFNYVYFHDLQVRNASYDLLRGYAIHWEASDPFAKGKGGANEDPRLELHFYSDNRALMIKKDGVTTLTKKGDRQEGTYVYTAEKDNNGIIKKESIKVTLGNGDVINGTFGVNATLNCKLEGPSAKDKKMDSVSFTLARKGTPSTKAVGERETYLPPQPLPNDKLPPDKTNWLLEKSTYATVVDVPRLPVPKADINYGNVASILKGMDRLEKLAAIDFLQKQPLDEKVWMDVSQSLDPNIVDMSDQFLRTNTLIALDRWSQKPNIGKLCEGIKNNLKELTITRKEFGQLIPVPADHELMVQAFVKIPDKTEAGKALVALLPDLYPAYRAKFNNYMLAMPSIEVQRDFLKQFNHKEPDLRDLARRSVLKFQKEFDKKLTDDEITEQCAMDMTGEKEVAIAALDYMAGPHPIHSDSKKCTMIIKSLEPILEGTDKETAAVRAAAGPVYTKYTKMTFVPKKQ